MRIISLGAGVQSSTMALMAAKGELPMPDCAIFADTGWEPIHVYKWLDWLETQLPFPVHRVSAGNIRENIVNSAQRQSRFAAAPFYTESGNAGGGKLRRQCTREFKITPIEKKVRELIGLKPRQRGPKTQAVEQWIGISTDEAMRMKPSRIAYIKHVFPLIEMGWSRQKCLEWFDAQGYSRPPKSACIGCPFHDDKYWRDMKMNFPVEFEDACEVDDIIRSGVRGTTQRVFIHRSLTPLRDVDFRSAEDCGQVNMFNNECEGMCGV